MPFLIRISLTSSRYFFLALLTCSSILPETSSNFWYKLRLSGISPILFLASSCNLLTGAHISKRTSSALLTRCLILSLYVLGSFTSAVLLSPSAIYALAFSISSLSFFSTILATFSTLSLSTLSLFIFSNTLLLTVALAMFASRNTYLLPTHIQRCEPLPVLFLANLATVDISPSSGEVNCNKYVSLSIFSHLKSLLLRSRLVSRLMSL